MRTRHSVVATAAVCAAAVLAAACTDEDEAAPRRPGATSMPAPATSTTPAASASTEPVGDVQGMLDRWAEGGEGGGAVAMAHAGSDVSLHASGTAGAGDEPLRADAEFRVGSIAKTFVAVMLMQLVEDGALSLDEPVTTHLPDLQIVAGVTVRQLLGHESGIPEHTDGELGPAVLADLDEAWTPQDVLDLVAGQERDFEPGTRFAYSNTNYVIAGLLLEQVSGATLAENLRSRVVEPLQLSGTYFAPAAGRRPIVGLTSSLPAGDTTDYRAVETAAGAAGALVSTAPDLATFLAAVTDGRLVSATSLAEMTKDIVSEGHGLGLFPSGLPTEAGVSNAGAIPGFLSYMAIDPDAGDLLVILVNEDGRDPQPLAEQIFATWERAG